MIEPVDVDGYNVSVEWNPRLDSTDLGGPSEAFPTTTWTRVLGAKKPDSSDRRADLDLLIRLYWKPVYWYVRRRWGKSNDDSKDLTQAFFTTFLEKDRLANVGPERGRFRTYLRVVLENFLRNAEEAARAAKRGGGARICPLQPGDEEVPFAAGTLAPDQLFDKAWAFHVFREASEQLAANFRASGRETAWRLFERRDLADTPPTYEELARELGLTVHEVEHQLKQARASFAAILRERVRETLADGAELEDELRHLVDAIKRP